MHKFLSETWQRSRLASGLAYAASVALSLAAFGLHHALEPLLRGHMGFLFYVPAVVVAAFLGGLGPGLVATTGSVALVVLAGGEFAPRIGVPAFLVVGLVASFLSEMARQAANRNADLRRAREQLMAIVAHDLRNPLNAVILSARLVRRHGSPEIERAISTIERNAARMEHLIRDLVDATRLETDGRLMIASKDEDARSIVGEALESADPQARAKSISLEASIPSEIPHIRCDRERILQVLGNLVGNAIKFTPAGGRITLRLASSAGFVRFEVADNGPGIARDDMPHLFERYWKGRASSGTGLGLFIAAGIVRAHGGSIWCHSEAGYGASFFFMVPVSADDAPASRQPIENFRLS